MRAWTTTHWMIEHMFVFAPAGAYVAQWLQSFREFPPRQKPGSFNLDRVMEAVTSGSGRQVTPATRLDCCDRTRELRRSVPRASTTGRPNG